MAVETEEILHPFAVGSVKVPRVVRQPNGDWSVEFEINFRVKVDDTRDVVVSDRHVIVRGQQRGRKARATHPGLTTCDMHDDESI
jgi:hypothetical protein